MQTEIDLNTLTKEQLIGLAQARGAALMGFIQTDNAVQQKIATESLTDDFFVSSYSHKNQLLLELGRNEEMILAGLSPGKTN